MQLTLLRLHVRRAIWGSSRSGFVMLVAWLAIALPARAAVELRVAVREGIERLRVGTSTPAAIRDGRRRVLGEVGAMGALEATVEGNRIALGSWEGQQLFLEPSNGGLVWIGDRWYRGRLQLVPHGDGILAISRVDLEHYLYSVVGGEMVPSWPIEALKAQAVAARSYALHKRALTRQRPYDLKSTTASQVYKGIQSETASTHRAVNETHGQVMTHGGQIILAVFHSSSGGHTENVEDVWSQPLPYLRGVVDYDQTAPVFQWTESFSAAELGRRLGLGTVQDAIAERTTPRGRVITLRASDDLASKRFSGDEIRRTLSLRSTLFQVSRDGDVFYFTGRGFGHGVGMSQWGAYYLAQQGVSYQQILGHYYPGASLSAIEVR